MRRTRRGRWKDDEGLRPVCGGGVDVQSVEAKENLERSAGKRWREGDVETPGSTVAAPVVSAKAPALIKTLRLSAGFSKTISAFATLTATAKSCFLLFEEKSRD